MNRLNQLYKHTYKVMNITSSSNYDLLKCYNNLINKEITNNNGYIKSTNFKSFNNSINYISISEWVSEEYWNNWYSSDKRNLCMNLAEVRFDIPSNQIKEIIYHIK